MHKLVTAAQMREFDNRTINEIGLPAAVLMETAGRRLAGAVLEELVSDGEDTVAVFCGGGNNGGDGFVCARVLGERGVLATVYLATEPDALRGAADIHFRAFVATGGAVVSVTNEAEVADAEDEFCNAAVLVDALFGTGLTRPIEGHWDELVSAINHCAGWVIAADVPSGIDADSGHVLGNAVIANQTVTMGFAKIGIVCEPGFEYSGVVEIAEIGIPSRFAADVSVAMLEPSDARALLAWPELGDYKTRRGHVLVIGGENGMRGAARLCARAALASGAGLVTWAFPSGLQADAADPIMTVALEGETGDGLAALLERATVVAVGPGLAVSSETRELVSQLLASPLPLVLDAGALSALGTELSVLKRHPATVITPHPGEAARLLGVASSEIARSRLESARKLASSGCVAVLKGARTVIDNGSRTWINGTGNPGMATAGSGDVLTGIVAAFLAQGLTADSAARLGVYVHGLAGDESAATRSTWSMNAETIIESLAAVFLRLSSGD